MSRIHDAAQRHRQITSRQTTARECGTLTIEDGATDDDELLSSTAIGAIALGGASLAGLAVRRRGNV